MKNDLTEKELRVMQYIDEVMRAEGITYEKMSQEGVYPQFSIPKFVKSLGITPGEIDETLEILESLVKKEYIRKIRKNNTMDFEIYVHKKWFKRKGA